MTTSSSRRRRAGRSGDQGPADKLRRRVTEVPWDVEDWFRENSRYYPELARERARAELTVQRDGYVIRWVHLWYCQLLEPDDEDVAIATAHGVMLEGTPDTDPRAPKVERQLIRTAGRDDPAGPGCVVRWEHAWVCQLLEPDGVTLIMESEGWAFDPATDPFARQLAADMALEAGI
jgi:hypothetical protein